MNPAIADLLNGLFECIGAVLVWRGVWQYSKDRVVKGVYWPTTAFFTIWGAWNCLYYPALGQWASFWGAVILGIGNLTWVVWVVWDLRSSRPARDSGYDIRWRDEAPHPVLRQGEWS